MMTSGLEQHTEAGEDDTVATLWTRLRIVAVHMVCYWSLIDWLRATNRGKARLHW